MTNGLNNTFNVNPLPILTISADIYPTSTVIDDADGARANLKNLIATASTALENALNVAIQSENPRAYEVVAGLIQTAADLSTRIMDTHLTQTRVTNIKDSNITTATQNNTTNNVIFSGTPAELSKMLKES